MPYDRAFIEGAPGMDPGGRLWPQEEDEDDDAAVGRLRGWPPEG